MKHLKSFKVFEAKVEIDNSFLKVLGKIEDQISVVTLKNKHTIIGEFKDKGGNPDDIQKIVDDLAEEANHDTNISKISAAKDGDKYTNYVEYTKEGQKGKQKMKIAKLINTLYPKKYDDKLLNVFNAMFQRAIDILNGDDEGEEKYMKKK